ncbi:UDP-N-acetylmuramoyl-L-alanine--D-glutamate ligase [Hylemonella gracilis]|uniref:UDP-N-acetylmuramoylalanine--D-glutamate ligase n=1 Tax=Hylemonella gracilis TaxID=80880 RepID=A0A4P6UGT7_9BURK|nr:UDP-N-acetylmuramoyl-L-alanine--D-glutamate ligase [Hylemonella gracilis]QBK04468.1 UDP-N-acetylmuramoyl-L-alanine--D-glutamate ligase [Hylemonella gracilis]
MNPEETQAPSSPLSASTQVALTGVPAAQPGGRTHTVPGMDTLTAGREAAAFVAALFADAPVADGASPAPSVSVGGVGVAESAESAETSPPSGELFSVSAEDELGEVLDVADKVDAAPVSALQGQAVLVLGLGASGLAMVRWCVRQGARVSVADTRAVPPELATLRAELPQVTFIAGEFSAALVEGVDHGDVRAVFKSPGLSPAQVAPVWQVARARGLWMGGELDLFAHALRDLQVGREGADKTEGYQPKVLAITGTNGKTTTTALTALLVEHTGKTVAVAGNIGPSLLDVLSEKLDAQAQRGAALPEVWVLELSSFQLDEAQGFEPTAAVVLNLTQDHLDWHPDMAAYAAAKARVYGRQGLAVFNRDDPAVVAMVASPSGEKTRAGKARPRTTVSFGVDMPRRPGDFGLEQVNGMSWLVRAQDADEAQKRRKSVSEAQDEELFIQRLLPADALRIRGRHNASNALAALALAQAAGCPLGPLLFGLREYRGEPHRVAPVTIVRDVEYVDDSKGTNVGATVAALVGLGESMNASPPGGEHDLVGQASGPRIVVILGGAGKGQDFSPLAEPVRRYVRAVILIGRDAPQIRAAVQGSGVPLLDAASMADAVHLASAQARAGDAVLLSPACASFDMFDNYEHRARVYVEAVRALAQDAGVAL